MRWHYGLFLSWESKYWRIRNLGQLNWEISDLWEIVWCLGLNCSKNRFTIELLSWFLTILRLSATRRLCTKKYTFTICMCFLYSINCGSRLSWIRLGLKRWGKLLLISTKITIWKWLHQNIRRIGHMLRNFGIIMRIMQNNCW